MTAGEKVDIVHQVVVELASQKEVAQQYNVSVPSVSQLVRKVRKKPEVLAEIRAKEAEKEDKEAAVIVAAKSILMSEGHLWRAT